MSEPEIVTRKGRALKLSTTETTAHMEMGSIVLMSADEAQRAAAEIKAKFGDLRRTIHEFDQREGWRALGFESFRAWAVAEIDQIGIRQVYRLLAAAETEAALGVTIGHTPESHLRPLAQLPEEQQREAWELAGQLAGDGPRQAVHVESAARALGDLDPLTDDEMRELSRLGGWEAALVSTPPGKFSMRLCKGETWDTIETRSPGGWRYELAQLQAEEDHAANVRREQQSKEERQIELIALAAACGLEMIVSGKKIELRLDGAYYAKAKNFDDAAGIIRLREGSIAKRAAFLAENAAQPAQQPANKWTCAKCGQPAREFYGKICAGCYHLKQASQWGNETTESRWNLDEAKKHAQRVNDPAVSADLLAEIAEIESIWASAAPLVRPDGAPSEDEYMAAVALWAAHGYTLSCQARTDEQRGFPPYWVVNPKGFPQRCNRWDQVTAAMARMIMSKGNDEPAPAAPAAPSPAADVIETVAPVDRDRLQQHAESRLSGLLERITPTELRMLHILIVGVASIYPADDESTAEEIWIVAREMLGDMGAADLQWIEGER